MSSAGKFGCQRGVFTMYVFLFLGWTKGYVSYFLGILKNWLVLSPRTGFKSFEKGAASRIHEVNPPATHKNFQPSTYTPTRIHVHTCAIVS